MSTELIKTHLLRAFDHYNASVKSYNYPVILDLASALFNLTELIDEITKVTGNVFTTSKPHLLIKKLFKTVDHIYFHLPYPITTYAKGFKGEMRETILWPAYMVEEDKNSEIRSKIRQGNNPNELKIEMFFFRKNKFNDAELETYNKYSNEVQIKDNRFMQYMTDPFIYIQLNNSKNNTISRKDLIITVANEHNARHVKKENFKKTKFTDPVRILMDFKLAGLPIPFFAILHIANDILSKTISVKKENR